MPRTPSWTDVHGAPTRALPLALLCAGALACSGASAAARASASAAAGRDATCTAAPVVLIEPPPRLVVTPAGRAYVVLRAGPERLAEGLAWDVTCFAAADALAAAGPDAAARLAASASELLEAYRPLAEAGQVARVSVTAMFGNAGARGVVEQSWFARDGGRWRAAGVVERPVDTVPMVRVELVRDPDEEAQAHDAATQFLRDVERADYDAAWARSSALLKAAMGRAAFERQLAAVPRAAGSADGGLYTSFPATARFLPGASMDVGMTRPSAGGRTFASLQLRERAVAPAPVLQKPFTYAQLVGAIRALLATAAAPWPSTPPSGRS